MAEDVLALFRAHAADRPDHAAVVERDRVVSYAELAGLVDCLAAAIAAHGEHPKVVIHCPAGTFAYAAMLATLAAGGIYAPLNLATPPVKQRSILQQFAPDLVVSGADGLDVVLEGLPPVAVIRTDAIPAAAAPVRARAPHDLAYVIFTSGSTGAPKGVMVPRTALARYVRWALRDMAITPDDRWSQHPNIAFDLSVLDIFGALCGGATLVPLDESERRFTAGQAIRRHGLTIWNSVPTMVDVMSTMRQLTAENLASLRLMTFCGEPLLPGHLDAIFAARPDLLVHNTYGPTEATVSCTVLPIRGDDRAGVCSAGVAIGTAVDGMGIHLIGGATPDEGEIVITGPQLAAGYWGLPEATAKAFREIDLPGGRVRAYFTGDWAERREGHVYFRNRIDFQTKVNGYRIELEEINHAIRACGVPAAVCVVVERELHAFLQAAPEEWEVEDLVERLRGKLEAHFIPARFHFVAELPRNANDKVDVAGLKAAVARGEFD